MMQEMLYRLEELTKLNVKLMEALEAEKAEKAKTEKALKKAEKELLKSYKEQSDRLYNLNMAREEANKSNADALKANADAVSELISKYGGKKSSCVTRARRAMNYDNHRVDLEEGDSRKESICNEWKNALSKVYATGYEMGSSIEESPEMRIIAYGHKCLPSGKEDSSIVAGLVALPGRSEVTNFTWSTYYKYPMVFAKTTVEELEALASQLLSNEDIRDAGRTANSTYVEELEEGNFIARCKNKKTGEHYYVGYMVEQDVCFMFNHDDDIHANHIKFYFSQNWGRRPEVTAEILALKERAMEAGAFEGGAVNANVEVEKASNEENPEDVIVTVDNPLDYSNVDTGFNLNIDDISFMEDGNFFELES